MTTELPRYRCHKEVEAAKIVAIVGGMTGFNLLLDGDIHVRMSPTWIQRHQPVVGGYYVRYADGYESFSPAAAFEEGYARI